MNHESYCTNLITSLKMPSRLQSLCFVQVEGTNLPKNVKKKNHECHGGRSFAGSENMAWNKKNASEYGPSKITWQWGGGWTRHVVLWNEPSWHKEKLTHMWIMVAHIFSTKRNLQRGLLLPSLLLACPCQKRCGTLPWTMLLSAMRMVRTYSNDERGNWMLLVWTGLYVFSGLSNFAAPCFMGTCGILRCHLGRESWIIGVLHLGRKGPLMVRQWFWREMNRTWGKN